MHCCSLGCTRVAEYEVRHGSGYEDYTHSCSEHVGDLLTAAPRHEIITLNPDGSLQAEPDHHWPGTPPQPDPSETESGTTRVVKAAKRTERVIDSWSPAKRDFARRVSGSPSDQGETKGVKGAAAGKIYVASRASIPERAAMWRALRDEDGYQITSSWIDEAGDGETNDYTDLWTRIAREIAAADKLVLYASQKDFPLKGAILEAGMALGMGKPVVVCLPGVDLEGRTMRPIGSWLAHPLVTRVDSITTAMKFRAPAPSQQGDDTVETLLARIARQKKPSEVNDESGDYEFACECLVEDCRQSAAALKTLKNERDKLEQRIFTECAASNSYAAECDSLSKKVERLEDLLRDATFPTHGNWGGPLCSVKATYEDGSEASKGHEPNRNACAALAEEHG